MKIFHNYNVICPCCNAMYGLGLPVNISHEEPNTMNVKCPKCDTIYELTYEFQIKIRTKEIKVVSNNL